MSLRRRMTAAALVLLTAVALAGCTTSEPSPTPTTTVTRAPLFASDAEALAAATKAYAAYQGMSDKIAHEAGADARRIKPFVTPDQWVRERKGFDVFIGSKRRTVGSSRFDGVSLAHYEKSTGVVELFLCEDIGDTRVIDSTGADVTPSGRQTRIPKDVQFVANTTGSGLLMSRSDVWSGEEFC